MRNIKFHIRFLARTLLTCHEMKPMQRDSHQLWCNVCHREIETESSRSKSQRTELTHGRLVAALRESERGMGGGIEGVTLREQCEEEKKRCDNREERKGRAEVVGMF